MDETAKMMSKRKELEEVLEADSLDEERIGALLETLAATEIHLDVLKRTKIGRTVNDVRKRVRHKPVLSKKTAELLLKWKKIATDEFLQEAKSRTNDSPKQRSSLSTSSEADTTVASAQEEDHCDQEDSTDRPRSRAKSSDSEGSSHSSNKDKDEAAIRHKSVEMIEDALRSHDSMVLVPTADPHEIAQQVEHFIFEEFKDPRNAKYRARVRSRVTNLSDELNGSLRELVLSGITSAEKLATMTSEELANDKLRTIRRSLTEELKDEHLLPDATEEHSTMFSCPQCKERDSMYRNSLENQVGEGGPVEVTLLACNKCGHHWKSF